LSRACLGKIIVFVYKWLKKTVFSPEEPTLHVTSLTKMLVMTPIELLAVAVAVAVGVAVAGCGGGLGRRR
jgi:hypothetical protein